MNVSSDPGTAINSLDLPGRADMHAARARIAPHAHITPVLSSRGINALAGAELHFKAENLQRVGAFKFRGACNAVFSLANDEASHGVITHSSGNHAAALALAARLRGVTARIVMPDNAPDVKKAAVVAYGGQIEFCKPTEKAREETVERLRESTPYALVHPFNDRRIIAGQATATAELLEQVPGLDAVITPVGGGGLLSGAGLAARGSGVAVFGAEPANADDAARSLAAGRIIPVEHPDTVADGLRTSLGPLTFALIQRDVRSILTVGEDDIIAAMRLLWERLKVVVEPSGAVPLAALMANGIPSGARRIGVILSGGNVDLKSLPWQ
ncbi:MAG: pyridoxal-phosphate dependent enzyme [Pseudomonadota bacterium]